MRIAAAMLMVLPAPAGCTGPSHAPFLDCPGAIASGPHALRVEVRWEDGQPLAGSCVHAWPMPLRGVLYGQRTLADGTAVLQVEPGPWRVEAYVPQDGRGDAAWINSTEVNVTGPTTILFHLGPGTGRMAIV